MTELTGAELDLAVAKVAGKKAYVFEGLCRICVPTNGGYLKTRIEFYSPSTNWAQLGPLIEEYGINIEVHCTANDAITSWCAGREWPMYPVIPEQSGPTPLIAACRAIVASKEEV